MNNLKNIIFDLGGVFLDVNYQKTKEAFENLGIKNFDDYFMQHQSNPLFASLEKGLISNEFFFNGFREETKSQLTDAEITHAWNAMLGDFFVDAIEWLNYIKDKYNIYIFSNTNQLHHDNFIPKFLSVFHRSFDDIFVKTYYSHELHLRKPDKESFEAILQRENILAKETLFIDDTEINTKAAKQVGLQTIHLKKNMKVNLLEL